MDIATSTRLLQLNNEIAQHVPGPLSTQKILDCMVKYYKKNHQAPCYTHAFIEIKLLFNDDKDNLKNQLKPIIKQRIQNSNEQQKLLSILYDSIDDINTEHMNDAYNSPHNNKRKCAE